MSGSPFATMTPREQRDELLSRTVPFDTRLLNGTQFDSSKVSFVELMPNDETYRLVVDHICKASETRSFVLAVGRDDDDDDNVVRTSHKSLGLGTFHFTHAGNKMMALHQTLGEPVGTDCGASLLKTLVVVADEIDHITKMIDELLCLADATHGTKFSIYRWHCDHHYWRREETTNARKLDSVVLPAETREKLVSDLDDFVSAGTRKWYADHGIPYKRSYLLHGAPGAGKTSLVQALAGRYKRSLAILTPSHPKMDDDGLKAAVQRVPPKSIIVLEDVDAIFAEGRAKSDKDKSSLTFSGVLNALDGVGGCAGQIFVLTTNHREKLDPALIRCGRVDVHVEFKDAAKPQMVDLFKAFYPHAKDPLAESFAEGLCGLLKEGESVSMAQLQHFFIQQRKATPEEAAKSFAKIIEEAQEHGKLKKDKAEAAKAKEKAEAAKLEEESAKGKKGKKSTKGDAKKKKEDENQEDAEEEASEEEDEEPKKGKKVKGDKQIHIHVH